VRFVTILILAMSLGLLLADTLIILRVWSLYPSNHQGYDIRWTYAGTAVVFAISLFGLLWRLVSKKLAIFGMLLSLASSVGIFILDHFNMLVEYTRWVKRGMPPFGG